MTCGVPQGSVLGPLLWNLSYNSVLKDVRVPGCRVIGYADDILIIGTGRTVDLIRSRTNQAIVRVMRRLDVLGLTVAPEKTEAVLFRGKSRPDLNPVIRLRGTYIRMPPSMKYLGIMLDSRMNFSAHFKYAQEKMNKVTRALCRLMLNLGGPMEYKRRLYANVLASVALYGAPIWCDALLKSEANKRLFRASQRTMTRRVCLAYRTVSHVAATLLARTPPLDLLAMERRDMYIKICEAGGREMISSEEKNRI